MCNNNIIVIIHAQCVLAKLTITEGLSHRRGQDRFPLIRAIRRIYIYEQFPGTVATAIGPARVVVSLLTDII